MERCQVKKERAMQFSLSRQSSFIGGSQLSLQTEKTVVVNDLENESELLGGINKILNRSRKIAVLTGAGISCNAGIPDFRSFDGLYTLVKDQYPEMGLISGQEMFDISLFRDETKISVFATFMERLYSNVQMANPTKTHKFIEHLKDRNKLLRCYTQNIDGLEEKLGLELSKRPESDSKLNSFSSNWKEVDVVQLHGDLNTLSCTRCFHVFAWNRFWSRSLRRGELPGCPNCISIIQKRQQEGKRVTDTVGMLRPNIVLYGENHPFSEFIAEGLNHDMNKGKPDFLLIMGTSLKVDGVKKMVKQMSKQVHERGGIVVLINKTELPQSQWAGVIDYQLRIDCDSWVEYLQKSMPDFFKSQAQVMKLRQLKREASEIRKQRKLQEQQQVIATPPTTPIAMEGRIHVVSENFESVKRSLLQDDSEELHDMKRIKQDQFHNRTSASASPLTPPSSQ